MGFYLAIFLFLLLFLLIGYFLTIATKPSVGWGEMAVGIIYFLTLAMFLASYVFHDNPYYKPIDPINFECYEPLSSMHLVSFLFFYGLYFASLLLIWIKKTKIPPLTFVLAVSFLFIGIGLNFALTLQITVHNTEDMLEGCFSDWLLAPAPILGIVISMVLLWQITRLKSEELMEVTYQNPYLELLNRYLKHRNLIPLWAVLLLFPLFVILTLILTLLGQDPYALVKVFTETATWRLSQKMHPPIIDDHGHYLCTVAAKGSPGFVKPLYLGERNGHCILVNRQLQIANAFEQMLMERNPKAHLTIRRFYDKYGLNLSYLINNERLSNATYVLMKPLEWVFLVCLYLFCEKPEALISNQYRKAPF
ncbi:MAG: hypothetical protein KIPDCIKN_01470 [Haliscomenobacter sp.]|nr:hypothetical protein [Haliscomenobacter sp.]